MKRKKSFSKFTISDLRHSMELQRWLDKTISRGSPSEQFFNRIESTKALPHSISIKSIHTICDLDSGTPCEFFRRFEYCIKCDNFEFCYPLTARHILTID